MGLPAPKPPIMIANRWSDWLEIGHLIWRAVVQGVYERRQRASYQAGSSGVRSRID
jgi:hypothetical protein